MLQRALLLVFLVKSSQGAGLGKCGTDETCNKIGLDYWGNDITHFPIESAAACACRCETYGDECQAWAFSPNNKYCWLKSRKSQPRVNRDRISGSKVCTDGPNQEPEVYEDGPFGGHCGPKGDGWSDQEGTYQRFPTGVEIRSGQFLDGALLVSGLKMKYGSGHEGDWHGGDRGELQTCNWDPSDRVVRVKGRHGCSIDSIQFETRNGVVCGPYGGGGGGTWEAVARPGCVLNYLSGTSANNHITSLTIHWTCGERQGQNRERWTNPMTFWTLVPGVKRIGPAELKITKAQSRRLVQKFARRTRESNNLSVSSTVEVGGVMKAFSASASVTTGYEHFTETESSEETIQEKDMADEIVTTEQIEKGYYGLVNAEMKMFVFRNLESGKIGRLIIPTGHIWSGSMNKRKLENQILDVEFTSPAREYNLTTYTHEEMQDLIALSNYLPTVKPKVTVPTVRSVYEDGPFGGHGGKKGDGWSDHSGTYLRSPTGVEVRSGWYIDGLKMHYQNGHAGAWHGGHGGGHQTCSWDPSDRVVRVKGRQGWYIDSIQFETRSGRVCGPYGSGGGGTWEAVARPGCVLNYLSGTSAKNRIASLTIHWMCGDDL